MSDGSESYENKVLNASGIVAAAKGGIKIPAAMKMAGFSVAETKVMRMYQQVRRKAQNMVVVDTTVESIIPREIAGGKKSGGASVVSSLTSEERLELRTTSTDGDDNAFVEDESNQLMPRRLLQCNENDSEAPPLKKSRRSSRDVHAEQASKARIKKIESMAMKAATRRVEQNNVLANNNPRKKSLNAIVAEVNHLYGSNLSPVTVSRYVRKGMIGLSPMKKGPTGSIPGPIYHSLKVAYASYFSCNWNKLNQKSSLL